MIKTTNSKNKIISIVMVAIVAIAAIAGGIAIYQSINTDMPVEQIELSAVDYEHGSLIEIKAENFQQLIADKKSFIVVAHMTVCPAEMPLTTSAENLVANEDIPIYSILESQFKETDLANTVRYLPSAAIYKDGELVAWLDAESNDDLPAYQSADGLRNWIKTYVKY